MATRNSAEIKLLGQRVPLRTIDTDPELTQEVVELVQNRIQSAEERNGKATAPHQVLLLALLELAEEYILAKRRTVSFKSRMDEKTTRLTGLLGFLPGLK